MSKWVISGIQTGIKTTLYPQKMENAPGVSPGLAVGGSYSADKISSLIGRCPTQVFSQKEDELIVEARRCIHCYRCVRDTDNPVNWQESYEWASTKGNQNKFDQPFGRSIHICVVDAGDCGACLNEVKQLNNPYYNMHRLGFFITPTPRHADVLLVVGCVTENMKFALKKAYDAMPTPKRVIAVGACALTGGVFADSFVCAKGVADVLPVDIEVPGDPPPPLAILHGLLVVTGRKLPMALVPMLEKAEKFR